MKKLSSLISAVIIAFGLAACGGKVDEAKQPVTKQVAAPAPQDGLILPSPQKILQDMEKEAKEKQAAADKAMEAGVTKRIERISLMKATPEDSKEVAGLIEGARYFGTISLIGWHKLMRQDAGTDDYAPHEDDQRARLVSEALVWVQQNPNVAEKIIDGALPMLRTKAELVESMRSMKKLLGTQYTEKKFELLLICSQSNSSYVPASTSPAADKGDEACKAEAYKFGIGYYEGRMDDNAAWMVKFLHRRHLNGGDKFAQWSQRQLAKLAN